MTRDQALWWKRAAQSLSRAGLLWLALSAVTLGSLVSTGAGLALSARLTAASNIGTTGKLKANGSGVPTVIPGELTHRGLGSDSPEAKRAHSGGTPAGLIAVTLAVPGPAYADGLAITRNVATLDVRPGAFHARAPPA